MQQLNNWIVRKTNRYFFSLKIYLEGNNETVKASTLLGNIEWIKKIWWVFGPSSHLHEMQEINDDMKIK